MKHNYMEEMKNDIKDYITNYYSGEEAALLTREEVEQELNDLLWVEDSVTGNASGSYYCNTWEAEEAVAHNWDLLAEALDAFGETHINVIEKGAEWCDVTIRCYLLPQAIAETLDEMDINFAE